MKADSRTKKLIGCHIGKKMLIVPSPPGTKMLHKWEKNEKGRWELKEELIV